MGRAFHPMKIHILSNFTFIDQDLYWGIFANLGLYFLSDTSNTNFFLANVDFEVFGTLHKISSVKLSPPVSQYEYVTTHPDYVKCKNIQTTDKQTSKTG